MNSMLSNVHNLDVTLLKSLYNFAIMISDLLKQISIEKNRL